MRVKEFLNKKSEQKRKLDELEKKRFEAREKLIVTAGDVISALSLVGCIQISHWVAGAMPKSWGKGVNPEDTCRVVGPEINYCYNFHVKNPLERPCKHTSCPMYDKYQKYLDACNALQVEKSKTR